jgi:hypothetical protein
MEEPELQYQQDAGLDRHVWESRWESLQEELHDHPAETLPALAELVGEMLGAEGYALDDPVASEGTDPEIAAEYREANRVATVAAEGGTVDPGDVGAAVEGLRAIYDRLVGDARGRTT